MRIWLLDAPTRRDGLTRIKALTRCRGDAAAEKDYDVAMQQSKAGGLMDFEGKVAVITGAASGIGRAVANDLARRNIRAMALVDMGEAVEGVAADINAKAQRRVAYPYRGDVTDESFRGAVYDSISSEVDTV